MHMYVCMHACMYECVHTYNKLTLCSNPSFARVEAACCKAIVCLWVQPRANQATQTDAYAVNISSRICKTMTMQNLVCKGLVRGIPFQNLFRTCSGRST